MHSDHTGRVLERPSMSRHDTRFPPAYHPQRIVEVCRKDRMTLQIILQREHSFQGTMTQLSSFLDEDNMATTMEFVNAFGNTAAARVREWLEEWLHRRSELPVDLVRNRISIYRAC
jgi:hypothetical protein